MTLKEAALVLGITPDTLRQAIADGRLKARKVGRDWTVTRAEVEKYAERPRRAESRYCRNCGSGNHTFCNR